MIVSITKVIALALHEDEKYVLQTPKAGADGYILKEAHDDELIMAIRSMLKGKHYISPEFSGKINGYRGGGKSDSHSFALGNANDARATDLKLIAEG